MVYVNKKKTEIPFVHSILVDMIDFSVAEYAEYVVVGTSGQN